MGWEVAMLKPPDKIDTSLIEHGRVPHSSEAMVQAALNQKLAWIVPLIVVVATVLWLMDF